MQLIAEGYDILKRGLGLPEDEIADIFEKWNKGVLDSFLIEITCNILRFKDDDGEPLVTKILDQAGQKGTGKWTAINALDAGTPGITLLVWTSFLVMLTDPHSHTYWRGRICPYIIRHQGGAYSCLQGYRRTREGSIPRRQETVH
jgi:6-phosphogluconate dehydrogenase